MDDNKVRAWTLDQIAKSEFFHQKLHLWELVGVAEAIESVHGEELDWNLELNISAKAWDKVIHRGIKPVMVFAHPTVLMEVSKATGYYRMLALVSQKSMIQVHLDTTRYERGAIPSFGDAQRIALHLNKIISVLIESDEEINSREFDLWRGMAAGSQAQGSWQNRKGSAAELVIRGQFRKRILEAGLASNVDDGIAIITLLDGRTVEFSDEPDIAIYRDGKILGAIEIKGGIDTAGVLERVGAAIKSLSRARHENEFSVTILILTGVSITSQARRDLEANQEFVNRWCTVEEMLEVEKIREEVFALVNL